MSANSVNFDLKSHFRGVRVLKPAQNVLMVNLWGATTPYPTEAARGASAISTNKDTASAEVIQKHIGVCLVSSVDVQHILSRRLHPFGRNSDETEYESLDTTGFLQSKSLQVMLAHELLIEVSD